MPFMMRTPFILLIACSCLLITACGGSDVQDIDACLEVEGATYYSVDQYECGLGENGVEMCNWEISFSNGTFDWFYSDIGAQGTYTCDGPNITGMGTAIEFLGYIDGETGILTWNNIEYQLP